MAVNNEFKLGENKLHRQKLSKIQSLPQLKSEAEGFNIVTLQA